MRVLGLFNMFRSKRQVIPEVAESQLLAQRISARADHINGQLLTYCRADDPFAAMMTDLYGRNPSK